MDLCGKQIVGSGQGHSVFYATSQVETAHKDYVKAVISHHANEPTTMAWDLTNEVRRNGCAGACPSKSFYPCLHSTWYLWSLLGPQRSAYVKSIDSNHSVALGGERFFNQCNNSSNLYQRGEGVDFTANLKISTLGYGTFHLYPNWMGCHEQISGRGVTITLPFKSPLESLRSLRNTASLLQADVKPSPK